MKNFKNCPICGTELIEKEDHFDGNLYCLNKCFIYAPCDSEVLNVKNHFFKIFNSGYLIYRDNDSDLYKSKIEKEVLKRINYWRENDRYLMEVLDCNE